MKNLFRKRLNTVLYTGDGQVKINEFMKKWSNKENVSIVHYDGEKFIDDSNNQEIDVYDRSSISIFIYKVNTLPIHPIYKMVYSVPSCILNVVDSSDAVFAYDSEKNQFLIMKYRGVMDVVELESNQINLSNKHRIGEVIFWIKEKYSWNYPDWIMLTKRLICSLLQDVSCVGIL